MTMLAVAPPWTTASSSNLRRTTSVLPIAIDRPSSSLPKKAVNARRQQTASAEISIASDAPQCPPSRGFLPWRFADAGPGVRGAVIMGPASENLHNNGSRRLSRPPRRHRRTLAAMVIRAARLAAMLLRIARGLRHADKGPAHL